MRDQIRETLSVNSASHVEVHTTIPTIVYEALSALDAEENEWGGGACATYRRALYLAAFPTILAEVAEADLPEATAIEASKEAQAVLGHFEKQIETIRVCLKKLGHKF